MQKSASLTKILGTVAVIGFAATAATANAQGFYVGGGLGYSTGDFKSSDFSPSTIQSSLNQELVSMGFPGTLALTGSSDENDLGWKLFGGYRFNQYFGVEGSYANFGTFDYNYSGTYLGVAGSGKVRYKVDSWNIAGVARYPFANGFSVQGKLGVAFTKAKLDFSVNVPNLVDSGSESESKTNLLWGVGVGYDFTPRFGVLAEYENYGTVGDSDSTGRANVGLWSVNVLYKF